MFDLIKCYLVCCICVVTSAGVQAQSADGLARSPSAKIVIAHRGACGYLPEHTLEAKALAYAMRPNYLEQDLVLTRDDRLIVLHDRYLDRVTNVAEVFPDRRREDGRFYAIDFTLKEIQQLNVTEGFELDDSGQPKANYPTRFPIGKSSFSIPTLEAELELIQGLNQTLGYGIGIYPEIKAPAFHRREGKDISRIVLKTLKRYGYSTLQSNLYLQCFDPEELQRIKKQLLPELQMELKLVQLIGEDGWSATGPVDARGESGAYEHPWMQGVEGLKKIAAYADGIGPSQAMIVADDSTSSNIKLTGLVSAAHEQGLVVHPYTFRSDPGKIPVYAKSFDDLLDLFLNRANVDGVFTDFPDQAVEFLKRQADEERRQ